MGQFGCYAYDGALKLSFTSISNKTGVIIPPGIDILGNVLRALSLTHIFYGFCLLLLFHLTVIFMIQSSMHEFNGKLRFIWCCHYFVVYVIRRFWGYCSDCSVYIFVVGTCFLAVCLLAIPERSEVKCRKEVRFTKKSVNYRLLFVLHCCTSLSF